MAPVTSATPEKRVQLQINTSGAWRKVISFDAANEVHCAEVMTAAPTLAEVGGGTLRICTDDGTQMALALWTTADGWVDFATRRPLS